MLLGLSLQVTLPCSRCGSTCSLYMGYSGSFSDGSGPSDYANDAACTWLIAPRVDDAARVILSFTELATADASDYVEVFQCADITCSSQTSLGIRHGMLSSGPTSFTSNTGYMKVQFTSDGSRTAAGFSASWSTLFTISAEWNGSHVRQPHC